MKIGRLYFERNGFWFTWFWQYNPGEYEFTQYRNGRAQLRDPIIILWRLIFSVPLMLSKALLFIVVLIYTFDIDEAKQVYNFL